MFTHRPRHSSPEHSDHFDLIQLKGGTDVRLVTLGHLFDGLLSVVVLIGLIEAGVDGT